jgi:hypothetical protein
VTSNTLDALVAASDRRHAALAALPPKKAAERERYYREVHKRYLRLSAAKRKRGRGDCSNELAAAQREAAAAINAPRRAPSTNRAPRRSNGASGRPRAQATRSSVRSGDSPDDDVSEPAPADLGAFRWRGYCLGCHQPGLELETRHEWGARALCDDCAAKPTGEHHQLSLLTQEVGPGPADAILEVDAERARRAKTARREVASWR